jgi:hypothetical protein
MSVKFERMTDTQIAVSDDKSPVRLLVDVGDVLNSHRGVANEVVRFVFTQKDPNELELVRLAYWVSDPTSSKTLHEPRASNPESFFSNFMRPLLRAEQAAYRVKQARRSPASLVTPSRSLLDSRLHAIENTLRDIQAEIASKPSWQFVKEAILSANKPKPRVNMGAPKTVEDVSEILVNVGVDPAHVPVYLNSIADVLGKPRAPAPPGLTLLSGHRDT